MLDFTDPRVKIVDLTYDSIPCMDIGFNQCKQEYDKRKSACKDLHLSYGGARQKALL